MRANRNFDSGHSEEEGVFEARRERINSWRRINCGVHLLGGVGNGVVKLSVPDMLPPGSPFVCAIA
jgi:hypothetical protein